MRVPLLEVGLCRGRLTEHLVKNGYEVFVGTRRKVGQDRLFYGVLIKLIFSTIIFFPELIRNLMELFIVHNKCNRVFH